MRRSLLKGKAHMHVKYRSLGFTNNLYVSNLEFDDETKPLTLYLDASVNQRIKNKESDQYRDGNELETHADEIDFFSLPTDNLTRMTEVMNSRDTDTLTVVFKFLTKQTDPHWYRVEWRKGTSQFKRLE